MSRVSRSRMYTTQRAADVLGLSAATLRNYAWLARLSRQERARRLLQEPPAHLPQPQRLGSRLLWPAQAIDRMAADRAWRESCNQPGPAPANAVTSQQR